MKNENSEDNLFSGLKKICKPMDSKLISKVNSKEIQSNKIHFDLDFLNSIVDKGNISNKNNNFLQEANIFSSLNMIDFSDKTIINTVNTKKINTKTEEYSFFNKKSNTTQSNEKERLNNLKKLEDSLKMTDTSYIPKDNKIDSPHIQQNQTVFSKVEPNQNGEFTFNKFKEHYHEFISSIDLNFYQLCKSINSVKDEQKTNEKKLKDFEALLHELSLKENQAIESNDFEQAQKIENSYKNAKQQMEESRMKIKLYQKELLFFREQEINYANEYIELNTNISKEIICNYDNNNKEISQISKEKLVKNKNDFLNIRKLKDQLDFRKEELNNEVNDLKILQDKVNKAIELQSNEICQILKEIKESKKKLISEIEEINLVLNGKYKELDKINKDITSKEKELETIKSNFKHELNKIDLKSKENQLNEKTLNNEESIFKLSEEAIKNEEINLNRKLEIFTKNLDEFDKMKNYLTEELCKLTDNHTNFKNCLSKENEKSLSLSTIENEIILKQGIVDKNKLESDNLDKIIRHYKSEIISIDLKIPNLEQEKKLLVVAKNFKQAGMISNELKLISEEKNEYQRKIQTEHEKMLKLCENIYQDEKNIESLQKQRINLEDDLISEKIEYLKFHRDIFQERLSKSQKLDKKEMINIIKNEILSSQNELQYLEDLRCKNFSIKHSNQIIASDNLSGQNTEKDNINSLVMESNDHQKMIFIAPKKKLDDNILNEDEINILRLEFAQDFKIINEAENE